ncbi:cobalt-precorrin-6A reductase [Limibaculum sp. M0105]|uniref:Cobalt-precorrin-6A reductase n=1 Tax=Thermohalobaculum xanthum TaxID=2753746 RepID=A0A8J7M3V7_9RHOB|nr:cobalt-precorrin-6A reductase [Thermohalobaculum xanthum]MBK0397668.1 cobalt-precorrin-6A reductase [Thermohalobaculum xanthum]
MTARVLLLAGTNEARVLAGRLWDMPGLKVIASLAGLTDAPRLPVAETRIGGFGGADGLAVYIANHGIDAVIDATHPFARRMPWNAMAACDATGVPRLRLLRPAWEKRPGWRNVADLAEAVAALPSGARVLLTTGRGGIAPFLCRPDLRIVARSIEPAGPLPPNAVSIEERPPFSLASEVALMSSHRITDLVSKNSGGSGTAKLDAAEKLGITTVMIARPAQPAGDCAETVEDAVAWLREIVGFAR